jgi:hypothetical protein
MKIKARRPFLGASSGHDRCGQRPNTRAGIQQAAHAISRIEHVSQEPSNRCGREELPKIGSPIIV